MSPRKLSAAESRKAEQTSRILEERARRLALPPEKLSKRGEFLELAAFELGAERYGVPAALVQETQPLRAHHWCRVPGAPVFITGALNLRGHIYSIMDLSSFQGLPAHPPSEKAHFLLVRGGKCEDGKEMELALLADEPPRLLTVRREDLQPPPASISLQQHVLGVTSGMLVALDLECLLSDPRLLVVQADG
jgi:chemotaxis signal transduction protein